MASIRIRDRADGTTAYSVVYIHNKAQTSLTFEDEPSATAFLHAVKNLGSDRAMAAFGLAPTPRTAKAATGPTLAEWLRAYIDSRSGITKACRYDYEMYLRNDIAPKIGAIPVTLLTPADVAGWVQGLADRGLAGKTVANRHGFLSAALNTAVRDRLIDYNPAAGTRIPRTERAEMCFLTHDEFQLLEAALQPRWRPMLRFMVVSGARFGELSALRPADVDRQEGTVRIARAWKRTYDKGSYELGPTKTKNSDRIIDVDPDVLAELDYSNEYLFVSTRGGPVRVVSWRNNVWYLAVAKAQGAGLTKKPRIHDMRHTCASWMIANGEPLPVIQRHLGHESIATTVNLYGHLDRTHSVKAAKGLGAMLHKDD